MKDKNIKLVNVIRVMLVRRILLCQRRAFNLWEFVLAEHQTLQRLYSMKHKNAWKTLFKATEVPPPITEDRGLRAKRPANPVSSSYFIGCSFPRYIRGRNLSLHANLTGLGSDSRADRLSSSTT